MSERSKHGNRTRNVEDRVDQRVDSWLSLSLSEILILTPSETKDRWPGRGGREADPTPMERKARGDLIFETIFEMITPVDEWIVQYFISIPQSCNSCRRIENFNEIGVLSG
jgi:hypothetical protein